MEDNNERRNLPFVGRIYEQLKKASKLSEEELKDLVDMNEKIAKGDVERGTEAIKQMRNELNEQNKTID